MSSAPDKPPEQPELPPVNGHLARFVVRATVYMIAFVIASMVAGLMLKASACVFLVNQSNCDGQLLERGTETMLAIFAALMGLLFAVLKR